MKLTGSIGCNRSWGAGASLWWRRAREPSGVHTRLPVSTKQRRPCSTTKHTVMTISFLIICQLLTTCVLPHWLVLSVLSTADFTLCKFFVIVWFSLCCEHKLTFTSESGGNVSLTLQRTQCLLSSHACFWLNRSLHPKTKGQHQLFWDDDGEQYKFNNTDCNLSQQAGTWPLWCKETKTSHGVIVDPPAKGLQVGEGFVGGAAAVPVVEQVVAPWLPLWHLDDPPQGAPAFTK